MYLLNTQDLVLKRFYETDRPEYAILSHRWGENEVTFKEVSKRKNKRSPRWTKLKRCCELARSHGFEWVWIDTCCIDHKSSAELSEAINSMYRWYHDAEECYAFIADVSLTDSSKHYMDSDWFSRGWTLQELLAPRSVLFYDREWREIGSKDRLAAGISAKTGIPQEVLRDKSGMEVRTACAATKMSWAARRVTSRPEDIAYCLLGIFGVNMPLLYGEGPEKAFVRLQTYFLNKSCDETIFAWTSELEYQPLLATNPSVFENSCDLTKLCINEEVREPWLTTNRGLKLTLMPGSWADTKSKVTHFPEDKIKMRLRCQKDGEGPAIVLTLATYAATGVWLRTDCQILGDSLQTQGNPERRVIYARLEPASSNHDDSRLVSKVRSVDSGLEGSKM